MAERPLDRIHIRDLRLRCIIGIYPDERRAKQDVAINLTIHADLSKAGLTDAIEDTIDYKAIKKQVVAMTESSEFFLLERLAEEIARTALQSTGVRQVDVCVDKPGALRFARSAAVEITRVGNG